MRRRLLVLGFAIVLGVLFWPRGKSPQQTPVVSEHIETLTQKEHRRVVRRTGVRGNPSFEWPGIPSRDAQPESDTGVVEAVVEPGMIVGKVVNASALPEGAVWVSGSCVDGLALTDADGDFFTYARPGACSVKAYRKYGMLRIWSEPVEVEVSPGEEVEVYLEVPPWKPAGLGISLDEDEHGIAVSYVFPGSPAEAAGLQAGDVITEIDGVAAVDLSVFSFIEYGIGEEGTDVDLVVESDASERSVTVTRGLIQR